MLTILCDCEAVINARPHTFVSENSSDLCPLTPAMFLYEQVVYVSGVPDLDCNDRKSLLKRIKYRQSVSEALRKRFRSEYLSQLTIKNKRVESRKINVGDVVLIGNDLQKLLDWLLARILELIKGKDGNVRVVCLRTQNGELIRPIQRVYPLEMSCEGNTFYQFVCQDECVDRESEGNSTKVTDKKCKRVVCKSVNEKGESAVVTETRGGRVIKKPKRFEN